MTEGADPAVPRRRLRIELRKARSAVNQSHREVAEALAWSPAKLLRIENGAVGVSVTDLLALLGHYGVNDREQVERLSQLAQASRRLTTSTYGRSVAGSTIRFWNFRAGSIRVRQFETLLIPGLLQTEAYAYEVARAYATTDMSRGDVDDRVAARLDQQSLLDRAERPEIFFIMDEAALHRWVGGAAVMRDQFNHLKEASSRPGITIQVLPFRLGSHGGISGPFQILEFAEGEDYILYLDDASGGITSRDMDVEVERFLTLFWDLEAAATKPWELAGFLDRLLPNFDEPPEQRGPSGDGAE